jgi:hypothetical protein
MGVYTDYFQKSKVFLYPLLKIRKGVTHVPVQTYIAWENVFTLNDNKFLCEYKTKMNSGFKKFIVDYLQNHELFEDYIKLDNNRHLFIFNYKSLSFDFNNFIKGEYSNISLSSKIDIIDFFQSQEKILSYIKGFLQPNTVHEKYAEELKVDVELIKNIHEVCDPPNLEKETLIDNSYIIYQLLEKSSISLTK